MPIIYPIKIIDILNSNFILYDSSLDKIKLIIHNFWIFIFSLLVILLQINLIYKNWCIILCGVDYRIFNCEE